MGTSFCMTVATVTPGGGGVGCSLVEEQAVQTTIASNAKPDSGDRRFDSSFMVCPPEHPRCRTRQSMRLSDCEDDPAERAALNQVTQSISRFGQWEGLSHDRFDRAGLKQRDDSIPGVSPGRLRLSEQYEALDAGPLPDQICDVNGCLAACRITQCCEASVQRKRSERLAQDVTTDPVDHHVCAVTACDTTHAVAQRLDRGINDLMESERLRLLGFRMIGRAGDGVFCAQGTRQLCHRVAD